MKPTEDPGSGRDSRKPAWDMARIVEIATRPVRAEEGGSCLHWHMNAVRQMLCYVDEEIRQRTLNFSDKALELQQDTELANALSANPDKILSDREQVESEFSSALKLLWQRRMQLRGMMKYLRAVSP